MTTIPTRTWLVPADLQGARLDRCLTTLDPGISRTRMQEWIASGAVRVNGVAVERSSVKVAAGQRIDLELRERESAPAVDDSQMELELLYDDEHLAAIDKPAGMLSHPTGAARGGTVSELAARRFGDLPSLQGEGRPGIVHRLDAGTSGVMLLAKSALAFEDLMRQFRSRTVKKTYLALVHGEPRFDSDWIETPIERCAASPERMIIAKAGEGRDAATFFEVRERMRGFALLECKPRTGRTHQIRVHLHSIGHPLVGDPLYKHPGPLKVPLSKEAPPIVRQALHANEISFIHPSERRRMELAAPLAADIAAVLAWLREHHAVAS